MLVDGGSRIIVELRDIEVASQPDELFEVPAGFTKLSFGSLLNAGDALRNGAGNPVAGDDGGARAGSDDSGQSSIAEDLASEDGEGAREGAQQGVRQGVRENVGRRIRGIFNRDWAGRGRSHRSNRRARPSTGGRAVGSAVPSGARASHVDG